MADPLLVDLDEILDFKKEVSEVTNEGWNKITEPLLISNWVIVKIRKTPSGYVYKEIASEKGDWEDLVCTLVTDFDQFKDRIMEHMDRRKKNDEMEKIARELAAYKTPYPFVLADFTDDWYMGFIMSMNSRILPDCSII